MYRYIFCLLILISACKDKPDTQVPETDTVVTEELTGNDSSDIADKTSDTSASSDSTLSDNSNSSQADTFEGIFITNLNTKTLRDCRYPDSVYWVADDTKKLEGQYTKMFSEKSVYNSVYVKIKGKLENTESTATGEKYPRTIRVSEVMNMERKNQSNTCVPYDFWGIGTGNSWTLQISKFENLIELIVPGEKKTYYFFYNEPTEEEGLIIYKSHNLVQRYNIEIRLKKESCTDTKSGIQYDYAIYVNVNGDQVYYGCAVKGKKYE